jgi:hypothetical protein
LSPQIFCHSYKLGWKLNDWQVSAPKPVEWAALLYKLGDLIVVVGEMVGKDWLRDRFRPACTKRNGG